MPVQCLIRKLTRAQVEKAITDGAMQERLVLEDHGGQLLLVIAADTEVGDPEAKVVLQAIADADGAIIWKEAEAASKAPKKKP